MIMAQLCPQILKGTKYTKEKFTCIQAYWIGSDGKICDSLENLYVGKLESYLVNVC